MKDGILNRTAARHFLRKPPEQAHESALRRLRFLDNHSRLLAALAGRFPKESWPVEAGGVQLDNPLILAAGLVKGDGFASEAEAMDAVKQGRNIIPGWRSVPALVGAVEMGSFTPAPRLGNPGTVLWRDAEHRTLYNRIGLRNPGARAAAAFLSERQAELPAIYGISLATDPDETDLQQKCESIAEAAKHFMSAGLRPSWVTVNLSCPNTEPTRRTGLTGNTKPANRTDLAGETNPANQNANTTAHQATINPAIQTADEPAHQATTNPAIQTATEPPDHAKAICTAVKQELPAEIPLWAKVGPDLPDDAVFQELAQALAEAGAKAIIAVNTATRQVPQSGSQEAQRDSERTRGGSELAQGNSERAKHSAERRQRGSERTQSSSEHLGGDDMATSNFPQSSAAETQAGMGGASLRSEALRAVSALADATHLSNAHRETYSATTQTHPLDIIGCGGILHGSDLQAFQNAGAKAAQYWSALVFRGPKAATLIARESKQIRQKQIA